MYQDKLANLKDQLKQLDDNIHPEYVRRVKRIEQAYKERIFLNEAFLCFEVSYQTSWALLPSYPYSASCLIF